MRQVLIACVFLFPWVVLVHDRPVLWVYALPNSSVAGELEKNFADFELDVNDCMQRHVIR
jgi:hypothetical protein